MQELLGKLIPWIIPFFLFLSWLENSGVPSSKKGDKKPTKPSDKKPEQTNVSSADQSDTEG